MRVVMLSAGGLMGEAALMQLIELGCAPAALVLHQPTSGGLLPVMPQSPLARLAQANGIAVLSSTDEASLVALCRSLSPDVLLSVCFPRRIPAEAVGTARLAAINAHTSSLPAWRGPDPVFWQLRHGASAIGLSLHAIEQRIDSGAVVAGLRIDTGDIASETELDRAAGRATAVLFSDWVDAGARTSAVSKSSCARGLWWRQPRPEDYRIFPAWRCAHAQTFLRIMSERRIPFRWNTSKGDLLIAGLAGSGEIGDTRLTLCDGTLSCWRLEPAEQR